MKQELPIAVGLLAIGGLLWLSGGWSGSSLNNAPIPAKNDPEQSSFVRQASYQDGETASAATESLREKKPSGKQLPSKPINPLIAEKDALGGQAPTGQDFTLPINDFATDSKVQNTKGSSAADFLHAAPDPRSVELLTGACRRIANSTPFGTSLKLTGHLFDQDTVATGKYYQMGQGTHRSRLELEFNAGQEVASSFQLCDGRFVYRLQTFGGQQEFEFVDLNRFTEQTSANSAFTPSNWIATGGLASLLEQFNQSFNFGAPKLISTDNQNQLTVIRGCWNETALRHTLGNQAGTVFPQEEKIRSRNSIPWDKIPQQLPHGIEVVFGNDPIFGSFPHEIRYLKFAANPNGGAMQLKSMMTLQFSHPQATDKLTESMFVIRSSDIKSVDTTSEYLAQVKTILAKRQAEKNSSENQQLK